MSATTEPLLEFLWDEYEQLVVYWVPPSTNEFERNRWSRKRTKEEAYRALSLAVKAARIEFIPTPCVVFATIYKKGGRGDAINFVYPIDKCLIDALTSPRGRKTRGLSLLPDDHQRWVYGILPSVRLLSEGQQPRTVLRFVKVEVMNE